MGEAIDKGGVGNGNPRIESIMGLDLNGAGLAEGPAALPEDYRENRGSEPAVGEGMVKRTMFPELIQDEVFSNLLAGHRKTESAVARNNAESLVASDNYASQVKQAHTFVGQWHREESRQQAARQTRAGELADEFILRGKGQQKLEEGYRAAKQVFDSLGDSIEETRMARSRLANSKGQLPALGERKLQIAEKKQISIQDQEQLKLSYERQRNDEVEANQVEINDWEDQRTKDVQAKLYYQRRATDLFGGKVVIRNEEDKTKLEAELRKRGILDLTKDELTALAQREHKQLKEGLISHGVPGERVAAFMATHPVRPFNVEMNAGETLNIYLQRAHPDNYANDNHIKACISVLGQYFEHIVIPTCEASLEDSDASIAKLNEREADIRKRYAPLVEGCEAQIRAIIEESTHENRAVDKMIAEEKERIADELKQLAQKETILKSQVENARSALQRATEARARGNQEITRIIDEMTQIEQDSKDPRHVVPDVEELLEWMRQKNWRPGQLPPRVAKRAIDAGEGRRSELGARELQESILPGQEPEVDAVETGSDLRTQRLSLRESARLLGGLTGLNGIIEKK